MTNPTATENTNPRDWVLRLIEFFSDVEHVDSTFLDDLLSNVPVGYYSLSNNAKDMVQLKRLEKYTASRKMFIATPIHSAINWDNEITPRVSEKLTENIQEAPSEDIIVSGKRKRNEQNSPMMLVQDSPETDSTKEHQCIRCQNGDQLLICYTCSLVIHENCLGCPASFDGSSKFICPVYLQLQARIALDEAKKKFELASIYLVKFIKQELVHETIVPSETLGGLNDSNMVVNGKYHDGIDANGKPKGIVKNQAIVARVHQQQAEIGIVHDKTPQEKLKKGVHGSPKGGVSKRNLSIERSEDPLAVPVSQVTAKNLGPSDTTQLSTAATSSTFRKTVTLYDWWLIKSEKDYNGRILAVGGSTTEGNWATRILSSSPIVKRHDLVTLETADRMRIILKGYINKTHTHENGFSSEVYNRFFLNGFPSIWENFSYHCEEGINSINILSSPSDNPEVFVTALSCSNDTGRQNVSKDSLLCSDVNSLRSSEETMVSLEENNDLNSHARKGTFEKSGKKTGGKMKFITPVELRRSGRIREFRSLSHDHIAKEDKLEARLHVQCETSRRRKTVWTLKEEKLKARLHVQCETSRRRKTVWTLKEKEKLKEGVKKYHKGGQKQNTPWRKILKDGTNVFQKCRRPEDLRYK